jgi:hypothetical protein
MNGLILYSIPRNASTSLNEHFNQFNLIKKNQFKFKDLCKRGVFPYWFDPIYSKPNDAYKVFGNEILKYFSFCVVRNPWDRAVSMYHLSIQDRLLPLHGIPLEKTFEKFCSVLNEKANDNSFVSTHKQIEWTTGYCPPKVILRFENLQEEFRGMLEEYNIQHIKPDIPHKNSTKHSHYKDYYTPETKKIIANVFEEDIDTFKYTFS